MLKQNSLYFANGLLYNYREAGNFVWGAGMNLIGIPYSLAWAGGQYYSIKNTGHEDEDYEVKAYTNGYNYMNGERH